MLSTITISGKVLGKNQALFPDWQISLDSQLFNSEKQLTMRDLLTQVILTEVQSFRTRQQQRLLTHVLTKEAILQGANKGKIDMGGKDFLQKVDAELAVKTALQAFEDGFYYVFIDDEQFDNLEQSFSLKENSQMLFLRLVPLVGG
jgi:hypothetical protein